MDEFRNFNYAANFRLKNELKKTNFLSAAMLLNVSKYQKTSFMEMLEVLIEFKYGGRVPLVDLPH